MPSAFSPEYWLKRAAEARSEAAKVQHPTAKRMLLGMAANYEQLAQQSRAQLAAKTAFPSPGTD